MKILHVIQRYWPYLGGAERHLGEVSERLARRGHDVTVVTTDAYDLELLWNPGKKRLRAREETHAGVRIQRIPVRHLAGGVLAYGGIRRAMAALAGAPFDATPALQTLSRYVPWVPDLERALANTSERYDLVHGMNVCFESVLFPARKLARRQGVPFVLTPLVHLGESERSVVRRYYTMPHQLELIASADAVLAQTDLEIDYLRARGVAPERIVRAGVGVNPDEVEGGIAERFRAATGVIAPFVLYVGACAYDKGTVHLVEAMRRLWAGSRPSAPRAALVLAGSALDSFRAYLEALPEADRAQIHILGVVDEALKRDAYAACSCLAMPSRTDSFGIVYLEAWLYRKAVIGARAGGVPAVIADGVDGFLVEFGDVAALTERLRTLLGDPELAARFGRAGREKTLARYTWDQIFPVIEEVYEKLCLQPTAT